MEIPEHIKRMIAEIAGNVFDKVTHNHFMKGVKGKYLVLCEKLYKECYSNDEKETVELIITKKNHLEIMKILQEQLIDAIEKNEEGLKVTITEEH